jgi:diguanylate cyclase (GGDEF)-like protein
MRAKARRKTPATRPMRDEAGLDELTGVWNRAGFRAAARPLFVFCRRKDAPVALAYFDFAADGADDGVLRRPETDPTLARVMTAMAQLLRNAFRASDVIGRVDTFRFAVLLADCADDVLDAAQGLRALADRATSEFGLTLNVSVTRSAAGESLDELMAHADAHARQVRRAGSRPYPRLGRSTPMDDLTLV